jgi:hypothetical protein
MTGCCTSSRKREDPLSPTVAIDMYSPNSTSIVSLQLGPLECVNRKPIRNSSPYRLEVITHKGEVNRGEPNVRFYFFWFAFLRVAHEPFVYNGRNIVIPGDLLAISRLTSKSNPTPQKKEWEK